MQDFQWFIGGSGFGGTGMSHPFPPLHSRKAGRASRKTRNKPAVKNWLVQRWFPADTAGMKRLLPLLLSALVSISAVHAAPNEFACGLYARLKDRPGNLFFSPVSVSTVLGMAALGAKGATADELDALLWLSSIERPEA